MADKSTSRRNIRRPSPRLTEADAAIIKRLLAAGELHHRIAAMFDVNQGRISEIRTGKRFPNVKAAA